MNTGDPVPLELDLHIVYDRFGRRSDPSINGHLRYPNDIDRSLNEIVVDKIRKCRTPILPVHNNLRVENSKIYTRNSYWSVHSIGQ